jgi:hypothetical protein
MFLTLQSRFRMAYMPDAETGYVRCDRKMRGRVAGIEPIAQIQSLTTTLFSSAIFDTRLKAADRPISTNNQT